MLENLPDLSLRGLVSYLFPNSWVYIAALINRFAIFPNVFPYPWLKPCFSDIPGKNDPHIRVLLAFPGSGGDKICGKKQLDLNGLTSQ
jgi:hypothetical protein